MARENYYLLLGLDPGVTDPDAIRARIVERQRYWSGQRNHLRRGREYQAYLQLVKDMEDVLTDPARRPAEASEATRLLRERRQADLREVDGLIDLLAAKGYLLEAELSSLVTRFEKKLSEAEIRDRLPVPIQMEDAGNGVGREDSTPRSLLDEIASRLRVIGRADLYAFLELPPNCDRDALMRRAAEREAEARLHIDKTAEVTASGELAGHALTLFRSDAERARYDAALSRAALVALEEDLRLAGTGKHIPAAVLGALERRAAQAGCDPVEARRYFLDRARALGISVEVPAGPLPVYRRCPCGQLAGEGASNCTRCGEPLCLGCPRCATMNDTADRACSRCGFAVGDMIVHYRLLRDAKGARSRGDDREEERLLTEAAHYWAESPEVAEGLAAIHSRREDARLAYRRLQDALAGRCYVAAASHLDAWRSAGGDVAEVDWFKREITRQVLEARQYAGRAEGLPAEQRAVAYARALEVCADLPAALAGMRTLPPGRPVEVTARPSGEGVVVAWRAPAGAPAVRYRVLRGTSGGAATVLAETSATSWTDPDADPGEVLAYFVLAVSGEGVAGDCAAASPVVVMAEASDVQAETAESEVTLRWRTPPGARRVEVYRVRDGVPGPPASPGSPPPGAVLLPGGAGGTVRDSGLESGATYGYRVCCVFPGPEGGEVSTGGVALTAIPCGNPVPPASFALEAEPGGGVRVVWSWAERGGEAGAEVRVYRAGGPARLAVGQVVAAALLGGLGPALARRGADRAVDPAPDLATPCYLLFGVNAVRACYAGHARFVELAGVDAAVEGEDLAVGWDWPAGCAGVRVFLGETPAGPVVSPSEGRTRGRLLVPLASLHPGEVSVRASCVLTSGGVCLAGPGVATALRVVRPRVLQWRVQRRGLVRRTVEVVVWSGHGLAGVERLVVVGKVNETPRDVEDGFPAGEWTPGDGVKPDGSAAIAVGGFPRGRGEVFGRLFAVPSAGVTVLPPPTVETIL